MFEFEFLCWFVILVWDLGLCLGLRLWFEFGFEDHVGVGFYDSFVVSNLGLSLVLVKV